MTTGEKILLLRKKNNMSQDHLANKLGVTRQAVSNWELDEKLPDIENAIKTADIFGVSLDDLLTDKSMQDALIKPAFINKYDSLDFLAAISAAVLSAMIMPYWVIRLFRIFWEYMKIHMSDWRTTYMNKPTFVDLFNASLDEMAVLLVLSMVIYISLKIAKKLNKNTE